MGIPSYFSYIIKNHPNIIKKLESQKLKINNLYLDCNSIIYDCIHNIDFNKLHDSDENTIIKAVCNKIDEYIRLIKPDNSVYIAFDGVAPVAKLDQQRSRRYKSLYQNKISKTIFKDSKPDPWNTTVITPGTFFMSVLNEKIKAHFTNPSCYNVKRIIISTSDKQGEGEHKLFEYIRKLPDEHNGKNTVIYGLDADLIMLSINHLPICPSIYLFRETPHFVQSINRDLEPNQSYLLDIPELTKIITLNMNNNESVSQKNRIYDYIFICFFLGNDFLPHFPSINIRTGGVDKMLNAYKETIGNTNEILTDGKIIYWKNVRKLVKFLSDLEESHFKAETKLRDKLEKNKLPNETLEDKFKKFDLLPLYERSVEKYINPYSSNWQNRYYDSLFHLEIDETRKKQISINYLEGLEWTMKYYTTGCPDWRWKYEYDYPPLLSDLLQYIPYFETEFIQDKKMNPVSSLVQLSYVLPKQSLHLLPKKLYEKLTNEYSHWYNSDCEFVWAYCRYFWEAHVQLPELNIADLESFVNEYS